MFHPGLYSFIYFPYATTSIPFRRCGRLLCSFAATSKCMFLQGESRAQRAFSPHSCACVWPSLTAHWHKHGQSIVPDRALRVHKTIVPSKTICASGLLSQWKRLPLSMPFGSLRSLVMWPRFPKPDWTCGSKYTKSVLCACPWACQQLKIDSVLVTYGTSIHIFWIVGGETYRRH